MFAQSNLGEEDTVISDEHIQQLKTQSILLLQENQRLEQEYQALSKELYGLQVKVGQHQNDLDQITSQTDQLIKDRREKKEAVDSLVTGASSLETQKILLESRRDYLRGQLLDMDGNQRVWALKLADSEQELRQLELSTQMKSLKSNKVEESLPTLDEQLQNSLLREKELQGEIEAIEEKIAAVPTDEQQAAFQISELEVRLDELSRERNLLDREYTLVEQKRKLEELKSGREDLAGQKYELEETVRQLEDEYDALSSQVKESLVKQQQRKKIINEIIAIDRENQRLREKIAQLQQRVSATE